MSDDEATHADPATGEIVQADTPGAVSIGSASSAEVEKFLHEMTNLPEDDPVQVQVEIAQRILDAATPEELIAATKIDTVESVLNQAVQINALKFKESTYEGPLPVFVVVFGQLVATGMATIFTTGATNAVLTLYKAEQLGMLPSAWVFRKKATASGNGRSVLTVEPAPA